MTATSTAPKWQEAFDAELSKSLPAFLPKQRWFGAKARKIARARAEDTVWLPDSAEPCGVVIARIDYAQGHPERYALMVGAPREARGLPTLGSVRAADGTHPLVEASTSRPGLLALVRALGARRDLPAAHGGALRLGDRPARGAWNPAALREDQVRPLGAEQSNTSLRAGDAHVFKLFRRLEPGENPEVEIGRFLLGQTSFRAAPALRASMTWVPPEGPPGTVGALQDRVEHSGDGWQWVLGQLDAVFHHAAAPGPLVDAMLTLGVITAEFHTAIGSRDDVAGFAPAAAAVSDRDAWQRSFRERAERVLQLVANRLDSVDAGARSSCERLLGARERLSRAADLPAPEGDAAFDKIRLHGDYHLGQTLRTADGFALIDFEGEPARPLAERRQLHCALRDVSGMFRSFDYALETAREHAGDRGRSGVAPPLRDSFWRGYESRARDIGARHLPAGADARARWLAFFELDKALYEIEYELQNRPHWLRIPAGGVLRLLGEAAA